VNTYLRTGKVANPDRVSEAEAKSLVSQLDSAFQAVPPTKSPMVLWRGVGKEGLTDKSFVSTSSDRASAEDFGQKLVRVRVPAGSKALSVAMARGQNLSIKEGPGKSEAEVLLPRGSQFRVISEGKDFTDAELVPGKSALERVTAAASGSSPKSTSPAQPAGPVYHGNRYRYKVGDVLEGGKFPSNQGAGTPGEHVYVSESTDIAGEFAAYAVGKDQNPDAPPHVYQVEPVEGEWERDPDEEEAAKSWRSRKVRITRVMPKVQWIGGYQRGMRGY
jgi:Rifampin ADP-ribosyl transferase/ADP-ribosyltransferase exoenzyme